MAMDTNDGLETYINLDELGALTEEGLEENYVAENDDSLTENYKLILAAYGFKSFFDLYTYALSNTSHEEVTQKAKQYDVLDNVKQTVTRNGRKMDTMIYSEIKDTDNRIKTRKESENSNSDKQNIDAEYISVVLDSYDKPITSEERFAVKDLVEPLTTLLGDPDDSLDYIILLVDPTYTTHGAFGFVIEDDFMTLGYVATDGTVDSLVLRVINEMVSVGLEKQLSLTLPIFKGDEEIQRIIAEMYNFTFNEELGLYLCDYTELVKAFGEDFIKIKETND